MKNFALISIFLLALKIQAGDIRSFTIGLDMNDFPTRGYTNIACKSEDKKSLKTWANFSSCSPNKAGLFEIDFEYDEKYAFNENYEGTQVAGHPVKISLGIDNSGILKLIDVKTDTTAPFYFRKQAYLMWLRVYEDMVHKIGAV